MTMRFKMTFVFIALLLASCTSKGPVPAADAPPSGRWSGDYGPDAVRRESVAVDLRWEENNLTGSVKVGVRSIPLTKATFMPATGAITMEFDGQGPEGQPVHYVIDGKVEGNMMLGMWHHDDASGDFRVTRE
jgi:hypothetical protein